MRKERHYLTYLGYTLSIIRSPQGRSPIVYSASVSDIECEAALHLCILLCVYRRLCFRIGFHTPKEGCLVARWVS